jgi:hypothetical protein
MGECVGLKKVQSLRRIYVRGRVLASSRVANEDLPSTNSILPTTLVLPPGGLNWWLSKLFLGTAVIVLALLIFTGIVNNYATYSDEVVSITFGVILLGVACLAVMYRRLDRSLTVDTTGITLSWGPGHRRHVGWDQIEAVQMGAVNYPRDDTPFLWVKASGRHRDLRILGNNYRIQWESWMRFLRVIKAHAETRSIPFVAQGVGPTGGT